MSGTVPPGSYKAAVIEKAGSKFTIKQLDFRPLKPTECLIKVKACGVCHSDSITVQGHMPISYPRVPGHESIGTIVAIGNLVPTNRHLSVGQLVGRGWHGGHCFGCDACMEGDLMLCQDHQVSGISDDGGYAEYMYCPWESLAIVPPHLPATSAGPLMCAGVTVFNALRQMKVPPPALVAVLGLGGLGHLAVQFAAKSGYTVVAISGGNSKSDLAKQLGAHHYIDNSKGDAAKQLQALGGADVIISTATDSESQTALIPGLGRNGVFLVIGIGQGDVKFSAIDLIQHKSKIYGWASGTAMDSQQTMQFAALQKINVATEEFSLDKVQDAYDRMMSGKARFRCVIVPGGK
jgi:alcohol dehydrogenase, propanol-preferring